VTENKRSESSSSDGAEKPSIEASDRDGTQTLEPLEPLLFGVLDSEVHATLVSDKANRYRKLK